MNVLEIFNGFSKNGVYKRIDDTHILDLFVGISNDGKKFFELHHICEYKEVSSTIAVDVTQYAKINEYNILRFTLINNDMETIFYSFCDDLIEQSRSLKTPTMGYSFLLDRFNSWKNLFKSSKSIMSENEIMGLIGELYFLKEYMFNKFSICDAIKSWTGSSKTHKDFSFGNEWIEVKAVSKNSLTVKISSIEQLDSKYIGILAIITLERMSEQFDGITLNKLVTSIISLIPNQKCLELFTEKLLEYGYSFNFEYDNFSYDIINCNRYLVDDNFPRLQKNTLPKQIVKASYQIDLSGIQDNIIN